MTRFIATTLAALLPIVALADQTTTHRVQFAAGKSSTTLTGKVSGRETVLYKINAKNGQFLNVTFKPDKESAGYNIYIPGRGPGDEALHISEAGGRDYLGSLYKTGDHTISVFLNRNAARNGVTANYTLHISVTDKPPGAGEEKPATGAVPQKIIDDCLQALRKQLGNETGMKVIKAERGENSFIIDVGVDSAEKPWRCFHDGTKCTGTQYQGEG
jgi:hypothetical protein